MSNQVKKYTENDTQGTGWSFTVDVNGNRPARGGLILRDVKHHGYNYAKEIRVVGLRLEYSKIVYGEKSPHTVGTTIPKRTDESEFFELNDLDFTISQIKELYPEYTKKLPKRGEFDPLAIPQNQLNLGNEYSHGYDKWPTRQSKLTHNFGNYPFYFGLEVTYTSKENIFDHLPSFDKKGIIITQTILFSPYQSKPSHEPSGGMTAARIHPLITTRFIDNDQFPKREKETTHCIANTVRYDHYLYLSLDMLKKGPIMGDRVELKYRGLQTDFGNSAGLFKDTEIPWVTNAIDGLAYSFDYNSLSEGALFYSIEKPLVKEFCGKGLDHGFPFTRISSESKKGFPRSLTPEKELIETWDNIHWWGSHWNPSTVISAPGAFHCSHMHWRWGHVVDWLPGDENQYKGGLPKRAIDAIDNLDKYGSAKQGALVDPNCWIQTIELAVVYYSEARDPSNRNPNRKSKVSLKSCCEKNFKDLFVKREPRLIPSKKGQYFDKTGGDLVLWFSVKKHKQVPLKRGKPSLSYSKLEDIKPRFLNGSLNGTIFIHGLFFPHDFDPDMFFGSHFFDSPFLGDDVPLHYPKSADEIREGYNNWERY